MMSLCKLMMSFPPTFSGVGKRKASFDISHGLAAVICRMNWSEAVHLWCCSINLCFHLPSLLPAHLVCFFSQLRVRLLNPPFFFSLLRPLIFLRSIHLYLLFQLATAVLLNCDVRGPFMSTRPCFIRVMCVAYLLSLPVFHTALD